MAKVRIYDKDVTYTKIFRDIKYPRLEFKTGRLCLILPKSYRDEKLLIRKHKNWVYKKVSFIERAFHEAQNLRLNHNLSLVGFKRYSDKMIQHFAKEMNVKVGKVLFRRMRTKWGSCASKGSITINTLLRFLPRRYIGYVVFHELSHLKERKHNRRFWSIIEKRFKDTRSKEQDLMKYWFLLQDRI